MTNAWNTMFGWPNLADAGSLSGGSWVGALPLTNLQDRRLHRVARSTNAALTSTTFDLDLGAVATFRLAALLGHNFSTAAKARVRSYITKPIVDWATVGDGSWTNEGTPTRSAAATTVNGIPLDLIGDDDGGAPIESFYRTVGFTGDAVKVVSFVVKRSSAYAAHGVGVYDNVTAAWRAYCNLDFTTAALVATCSTGTLLSAVELAPGAYRVTIATTAVTAANQNIIWVYPAPVAEAHTAALYIGDIQAWNAATDQFPDDSGWVAAWPTGVTAAQMGTFKPAHVYIASADVTTARYLRIGLNDTANAAGYLDVGRLVVAPVFQPTINLSYGAAQGFEDDSTRTPTDGGAFIYATRSRRRTLTATLADLPQDEALANLWEMQRQLGTTGQFLCVFDPTDTTHLWRRSMLATFRDLSPMEMASYGRYTTPIALVEDL